MQKILVILEGSEGVESTPQTCKIESQFQNFLVSDTRQSITETTWQTVGQEYMKHTRVEK